MIICGIDPGNVQSAFVIWDTETKLILDKGILENNELAAKLMLVNADEFIVEMIASYGMAVGQTVFETCVWIGRFMEVIESLNNVLDSNYKAKRITRNKIKNEICHSSRAKDSNIRQALMDMYGGTREAAIGTKKNPKALYGMAKDMWAALAVCVAWYGINAERLRG